MRADRHTSTLARFAPAAALVYLLSWHAHDPAGRQRHARRRHWPLRRRTGLTIEGPVKVNLNGFKILCAADITGIEGIQ